MSPLLLYHKYLVISEVPIQQYFNLIWYTGHDAILFSVIVLVCLFCMCFKISEYQLHLVYKFYFLLAFWNVFPCKEKILHYVSFLPY